MIRTRPALVALLCIAGALATGSALSLDADAAKTYAGLALACVDRPFPYKTGHVLVGKESLEEPRHFHPVFYGCYDWHSSVHGHWTLVRILKLGAAPELEKKIRASLAKRFTKANFEREAAFFERPHTKSFERPYGWAWLLRLSQELHAFGDDEEVARWREAIRPLENTIVRRYMTYLPKLTWPIRSGVHPNTAFALSLGLDYARVVENEALEELIVQRAHDYYLEDVNAAVDYEPSGEDFFSPSLLEADLMRRVLSGSDFAHWLAGFMPGAEVGRLGGLIRPATVSDASDPKIVHLDGLNLVRAWTFEGIASALSKQDRRRNVLGTLAADHLKAGVSRVSSGHYSGEHWLASFALYAQTRAGIR